MVVLVEGIKICSSTGYIILTIQSLLSFQYLLINFISINSMKPQKNYICLYIKESTSILWHFVPLDLRHTAVDFECWVLGWTSFSIGNLLHYKYSWAEGSRNSTSLLNESFFLIICLYLYFNPPEHSGVKYFIYNLCRRFDDLWLYCVSKIYSAFM